MAIMYKILILFVALYIMLPAKIAGASNFFISSEVTYEITSQGVVAVSHNITITNKRTEVHATDYTLTLIGANIEKAEAFGDNVEHDVVVTKTGNDTELKTVFNNPVLGDGKSREFKLTYIDNSILRKNGDVSEIVIPKLINKDDYDSYLVRLVVPTDLGEPAYISPHADNILQSGDRIIYYFNKTSVNVNGVSLAFGEHQLVSFDLTYHLQNPLALPSKMEIALPPDTSYQKVSYDSLSPSPDQVYKDKDGNWMAVYKLAPRERLDVRAIGSVQVFANPWRKQSLNINDKERYLSESTYWQVNDSKIRALARELKTPVNIYNYVVSTLDYNYDRVSQGVDRLGALGALSDTDNAICTEFTDLFIALSRAAGIPAREINGYAHTENQIFQPLSLVADVLHAWPEYWDEENSVWIPVDPTWGDTTGGSDYFSKLDMNHFVFVMHGEDPNQPIPPGSYKLGSNPQKDVFVSVGAITAKKLPEPEILLSQKQTLPFGGVAVAAEIENVSGQAIYGQKFTLYFDDEIKFERELEELLPFEKKTLEFSLPTGFLGSNIPEKVTLITNSKAYDYIPGKNTAIMRDFVLTLLLSVVVVSGVYVIIKRYR